eukprot:gene16577-25424_t
MGWGCRMWGITRLSPLATCLAINSFVYASYGIACLAAAEEVWKGYQKYPDTPFGDLPRLLVRMLGSFSLCSSFLCCAAAAEQLSSLLQRRSTIAYSSAVFLSFVLIEGMEGLSSSTLEDKRVLIDGGVATMMVVLNCTFLMHDILRNIPDPDRPSGGTGTKKREPAADAKAGTQASRSTRVGINGEGDGGDAEPLLSNVVPSSFATFEPAVPAASNGDGLKHTTVKVDENAEAGGEDESAAKTKAGWGRLLLLARPERRIIAAGCLALVIRLPFSLSIPHFVSECIGCLIARDESGAIRNIILLMIAGTVDAILDFWNFFLFGFSQQRLIKRLRVNVFSALLSQEVAYFDSTTTGEITSRLQVDTNEMGNDLTWVFRWTIEAVVRILGVIGYMFFREYRLALVTIAVIPVCAVVNKLYGDWLEKNAERVQTALAESNDVANEVLASVRTVFSFHNQDHEIGRYDAKISKWYHLNVKQ